MPGPWDDLMKMLVGANPQHFVTWLVEGAEYKGERSTELKNRTIEADILYNLTLNGKEMVLHIEFQRRRDGNMGKRLWEYNVLTTYTSGVPVCSFAIYLRKDGRVIEPPYQIAIPNGETVHLFYYKNVKLWEVPTEALKQTGLIGLFPLLPLTKDGARQEVVDEMITELVVAGEKNLLALSQLLGALAFKPETTKKWFRKRFTVYNDIIEESWVYQEWAAREQRRTLFDIVQERFPEILNLVKKQAESIEDPEVLRRMAVKMSIVQTPEEAKQYLLTVSSDEIKH